MIACLSKMSARNCRARNCPRGNVGAQLSARNWYCAQLSCAQLSARNCRRAIVRRATVGVPHRRSEAEMKDKLEEHEANCFAFTAQRTTFPEDPVVRFKNIKNQVKAPFVVYADFESILKHLNDGNKYQEHIACSYAYQIISNIPGIQSK